MTLRLLRGARPIAALALLLFATGLAQAEDIRHDFTFEADELTVVDLIGQIRVEAATGGSYEVVVTVTGADAAPGLLDVELDEGRKARLVVRFPVDEHRTYIYPALGRGSTTIWQPDQDGDRSWLSKIWHSMGGEKVTVKGSGRGLEVWADITVRVPADRETSVYLAAGDIKAGGIDGKLVLDTSSGPVDVTGHRGKLVCDTGSGEIRVSDVDGPVLCDTGSGAVRVSDQRGGKLEVDTGSGSVRIDGADTEELYVDTGSGGVTARGVKTDKATIDTGSGSVELQLDRMGGGRFVIDTGSGGVELTLPDDASATISVDTGSGGIRTDLAAAEVLHKEQGELKVRVGDGDTRVIVDTGSGGVTIAQR